ncbi:MAG: DUF885 domain-containing protein [Ardenticatenaceae bacterium]|nr:DUF885 domain-containing protein [Ardenticatenaceae bacterium]
MSLHAFDALGREYERMLFAYHPTLAAELGLHEYLGELGDFHLEAFESEARELRGLLRRWEALAGEVENWPVDQRIDYAWLGAGLRDRLRDIERFALYRRNPLVYLEPAVFSSFPFFVRPYASATGRLRALVSRLEQLPAVLDAAQANLLPPQVPPEWVKSAAQMAEGGALLYRQGIAGLAAEVDDAALLASADAALPIAEQSLRAFTAYLTDEVQPAAQGAFAIGEAAFNELLRERHFLDIDAAELLAIGERLYAETEAEMETVAATVMPGLTASEIVAALNQEHLAAEEVLAVYTAEMERARQFVFDNHLVGLPAEECLIIEPTPAGMRPLTPYAAYIPPGPFEADQVGIFLVTTVDPQAPAEIQAQQLQGHSRWKVPTVALHEGLPGHHLQLTWSNHNPSRLRKLAYSTLFVEGWAFYCEQLLDDLGYLAHPKARLYRLAGQLWRAMRIILDVSLHTRGMSPARAAELLQQAGLDAAGAAVEVQRYLMMPTQPMSYLIGKLEILKIMAEYQEREGNDFTLRKFHDTLLAAGSIPTALVRLSIFGE